MLDDPIFSLAMQIDGQAFSACGTKIEVLKLYAQWLKLTDLDKIADGPDPPIVPAFNAPRFVRH